MEVSAFAFINASTKGKAMTTGSNDSLHQASTDPFNFAKFVPGFDFLKNLSQQATGAAGAPPKVPGMPDFSQWIAPTLKPEELEKRIQELKTVQFWLDQNAKMLAATIQALEVQKMTLGALKSMNFAFTAPAQTMGAGASAQQEAKASASQPQAPAGPDPMQLWQAMSEQFQTIASTAMKDVSPHSATEPTSERAAKPAQTKAAKTPAPKTTHPKAAPKKTKV
jgi:hypothetical protein